MEKGLRGGGGRKRNSCGSHSTQGREAEGGH